jgi:tetratricopeptide (TPR) repeat protein
LTALVTIALSFTNWPTGLDEGRAAERTEMILSLIERGRSGEADALLASTERMHADPALLLYRAGREYAARGAPGRAASLLERAHGLAPSRGEIRLTLGQALVDAGRSAEAVPHLRAAAEAGPRRDLAAFDLARALKATGRRDEAIAALRSIPSPERLDVASQLAVGRLALDLGDASTAQLFIERAVIAAPDVAAVREAMGLVLRLQGRRDDAIASLEEACRLDPASASARLNLAVLYAEAGRRDDALARAGEALRLRPGYPQAEALIESLRAPLRN